MTTTQLQTEMLYHASLEPFTCLLNDGVISAEDYEKVNTILANKYHPIFVGYTPSTRVDNSRVQS